MKFKDLLGMALLGLIPLGVVVSCDPMRTATPEEKSELVSLDEQLEAARADIEETESALKVKLEAVKAMGLRAASASTLEEAESIREELKVMVGQLEIDAAAWEKQLDVLDALGERAAEVEGEIGSRQTSAAAGILGAIDPRLGALGLILGPLIARIGSERSRAHLADAARKAIKLALGESIASLVKAYGFTHTDESSLGLTARAQAAARKEPRG